MAAESPTTAEASGYTVVARRYRPKSFAELIGQTHIAQALERAIATGRVGHAYLFTGARGVGKTSTARIFAKALNLPEQFATVASDQPTAEKPVTDDASASQVDNNDEVARAIDAGEDMDVIEIDGASNRGIDEIRQLRANVNVRPSRSPFKIYIIDEVHMLTAPAFNALLKTLEEPPPHVKFIFCTTDPEKIPITVLSRCQRFDFAPVKLDEIRQRLSEICQSEGYEADEEALLLLARRAAGSMRDSQSLLEQVMSFSSEKISLEQVHELLGTADESRLLDFVEALLAKDALRAIQLVEQSTQGGSDAGQIAEQLLGYLRDVLAVGVGGDAEILKLASPNSHEKLQQIAQQWGNHTVLSSIQILDECLVRMRSSVAATTLLELAMVQICQLEDLSSIPALLEQLGQPALATAPAAGQKKKVTLPAETTPEARSASSTPELAPKTTTPELSPQPNSNTGKPVVPVAPAAVVADTVAESKPAAPLSAKNGNPAAPGLTGREPDAPAAVAERQVPDKQVAEKQVPERQVPERQVSGTQVAGSSAHEASVRPAVAPASVAPASGTNQASGVPGNSPEALHSWKNSLKSIDDMLSDYADLAVGVVPQGSDRWTVVFPPGATQPKEYCEDPEKRKELQGNLASHLGREVQLSFDVQQGVVKQRQVAVSQSALRAQKLREMSNDPYVKRLCEVLGGEIVRVDPARDNGSQSGGTHVSENQDRTVGN